ncbi:MAG TPA: hypothetical protein VN426_17710, partial [Syntrophomonadaceae bacterium]|nr:hypothetical protein [Syntrophomonadaceae bacterium]
FGSGRGGFKTGVRFCSSYQFSSRIRLRLISGSIDGSRAKHKTIYRPSNENTLEIYRHLQTSQDKYTYFLLATTIAAIGFAITQTKDLALNWTQVPVGISVLSWGLSFLFGCLNRLYYTSALYANLHYIRIRDGEHPEVGIHPQRIQAASEGINIAMNYNSEKANKYGRYQMFAFTFGSIAYIAWHILEMYLRK